MYQKVVPLSDFLLLINIYYIIYILSRPDNMVSLKVYIQVSYLNVSAIRKQDGSEYEPVTLAGIQ